MSTDLGEMIAAMEEDLRLFRKYNADTWHDDPAYAGAAAELARLRARPATEETP